MTLCSKGYSFYSGSRAIAAQAKTLYSAQVHGHGIGHSLIHLVWPVAALGTTSQIGPFWADQGPIEVSCPQTAAQLTPHPH